MKKSTKIYKYECVTERKCTRITDAKVWSSVREKDKENEREKGTDEGCYRIYERK